MRTLTAARSKCQGDGVAVDPEDNLVAGRNCNRGRDCSGRPAQPEAAQNTGGKHTSASPGSQTLQLRRRAIPAGTFIQQ
jgi:hypothetical protein